MLSVTSRLRPFATVRFPLVVATVAGAFLASEAFAERPPLTKNVPVWEFQNNGQDGGYDFDAPPKGIFHTIHTAESFDQEMGFRRTYDFVPVNPTEQFRAESPAVYVVFSVHEHYATFQVNGRCYPEDVEGLASTELVAEDAVQLHLEDNSGYLQLFPPPGGWKPGKYKVEIHVGYQVTGYSLVGTMRFTVVS